MKDIRMTMTQVSSVEVISCVILRNGYLIVYLFIDIVYSFVFFFQAEDGIRDLTVTGVQTCALPIFLGRNGDARILTELTLDRAKVVKALTGLQKFSERKMPHPVNAPKVLQDAALSIATQRPNSQVQVVMLTDSVFLMNHAQRDEVAANLLRANITFNALITGMDLMFKLFTPILKPAEDDLGVSWYDSPQYLAKLTGGDSARPHKKKEYGAALERLIGSLTARYSIGFTLSGEEFDDGTLHRLEVKVEARDSQGQKRQVEVSARKGYYIPKK